MGRGGGRLRAGGGLTAAACLAAAGQRVLVLEAHDVAGGNCAGEILERPLLIELVLGTHLAEPGSIPPDPPGFDALEWSRGQRLRDRRAEGRAAREAASI